MSSEILNIAGYRFVDLPDRDDLRELFLELCTNLELRGTVLLSPNGINFFLAGPEGRVSDFIDFLESDIRFTGIPIKTSYTDYQPFKRMLVKRKNEIISLGLQEIKPVSYTHLTLPTSDLV